MLALNGHAGMILCIQNKFGLQIPQQSSHIHGTHGLINKCITELENRIRQQNRHAVHSGNLIHHDGTFVINSFSLLQYRILLKHLVLTASKYEETQDYVLRVLRYYHRYRSVQDVVEASQGDWGAR